MYCRKQGCALAEPIGPLRQTFALGRLENLRFFIQIICRAPWILQVPSTGLPSIFLRAQPWAAFDFSITCFSVVVAEDTLHSQDGLHLLQTQPGLCKV